MGPHGEVYFSYPDASLFAKATCSGVSSIQKVNSVTITDYKQTMTLTARKRRYEYEPRHEITIYKYMICSETSTYDNG